MNDIKKSVRLFNAVVLIVQETFKVSRKEAKELVGRTADYNIVDIRDVIDLIESWVR